MRLVLQLVARLFIVVILCLGAATVWATVDAYRSVDRATAASAERVAVALEALYWRELLLRSSRMREQLVPTAEWRTIQTMGLISPGICVRVEPAGAFEKPLCGQSKGIGQTPPRWFAATVETVLGSHAPAVRPISTRADTAGSVSASPDPHAAIALAWQHVLDNIHLALLMAVAIALLASLAIAHTLAPARQIVTALQRMARGEYRTSLPRFRSVELAMIGQAVGELGDRLEQATEERAALTRRLLEIRSDERRALARELHDEFGQNLTAILAFANTIEAASAQEPNQGKNEVAQDARMISQATHRIMACLRDTAVERHVRMHAQPAISVPRKDHGRASRARKRAAIRMIARARPRRDHRRHRAVKRSQNRDLIEDETEVGRLRPDIVPLRVLPGFQPGDHVAVGAEGEHVGMEQRPRRRVVDLAHIA